MMQKRQIPSVQAPEKLQWSITKKARVVGIHAIFNYTGQFGRRCASRNPTADNRRQSVPTPPSRQRAAAADARGYRKQVSGAGNQLRSVTQAADGPRPVEIKLCYVLLEL